MTSANLLQIFKKIVKEEEKLDRDFLEKELNKRLIDF